MFGEIAQTKNAYFKFDCVTKMFVINRPYNSLIKKVAKLLYDYVLLLNNTIFNLYFYSNVVIFKLSCYGHV